jgi:hypothetical protein
VLFDGFDMSDFGSDLDRFFCFKPFTRFAAVFANEVGN